METEKGVIQTFEFNGAEIEFDFSPNKVMVNATEMAKIFDKKSIEFLDLQNTKAFIQACISGGNSHHLNVEKESDLVIIRPNKGTWMHRVLALKFAAWLDPNFEIWIYQTIDELMFGRYKRYVAEVEFTDNAVKKLKELEEKKQGDPEYLEILELKKLIAGSGKRRSQALNGQLSIF